MKRFKFLDKKEISRLPKSAGVYIFSAVGRKKGTKFLYIGKAGNLKERIKNHFSQPTYRDDLFLNLVTKIGYLKTDSEIEALILEAGLIKKYQPRYNVDWRDDKKYFFVEITKEDFPRIFITHQVKQQATRDKRQVKYVGPFVDGKALKQTLKMLAKAFPYRMCRKLPKKPCLWYQLGRCPAPCILNSDLAKQIPNAKVNLKKESKKNTRNIIKILQGRQKQVLADLKKKMKVMSKIENFEGAKKKRDQIRSLEKVMLHANIFETEALLGQKIEGEKWKEQKRDLEKIFNKKIERIEGYDVSNLQGKEATGSMVTFIKGLPDKNFYRRFKIKLGEKPNDTAMLGEILKRRFLHIEWGLPDLILIDGGKAQLNIALKVKNQSAKWRTESKNIKVASLAKKENKLFIEEQGAPKLLKNLPREVFNIILQIRDEAHRFAISYHRKLRKKAFFR